MSGIDLITAERARQIAEEGWTPEHDDQHVGNELLRAAACYIIDPGGEQATIAPEVWPWEADSWKPGDRVRNLVKAGALIAAEVDRLQRLARGWDGRKVFDALTGEYLGRAVGEPRDTGDPENASIALRQDEDNMTVRTSADCGLVVLDSPGERMST